MNAMLEKVLGPSPVPAALGYIAGSILDIRVLVESEGLPTTFGGWATLAIGVVWMAWGRSQKQVNVTNANTAATIPAHPVAEVTK
jgi:hypothetical protein